MEKTRIRQLRLLGGFSQAEISKGTRIHYSTISRIENGIITPNKRHIRALTNFFKVDKDLLFPGDI